MSTPFSRSIRMLDADKFRPSLLVIAFAIVVLIVWLLWLVFAHITLMETGRVVNISPVGEVQSQFTSASAQQIRVGQLGFLQLDGEAAENIGLIPVIVVRRYPPNNQNIRIDLLVLDERFYAIPSDGAFTGRVQVETRRLSPLTLFMRASGQFVGAPRVSTNPQPPSASADN